MIICDVSRLLYQSRRGGMLDNGLILSKKDWTKQHGEIILNWKEMFLTALQNFIDILYAAREKSATGNDCW